MLNNTTTKINHKPKTINLIKKFTEDKEYSSLKKLDDITQRDAIQRMYKNINIPQEYPRIKYLKNRTTIEILYNAQIHIIKK